MRRLSIFIVGLSSIGIASTARPSVGAAQTPRDPLYQQITATFVNNLGENAPGGALAIIYNGTIEYTVGIGKKEHGGENVVDANTLFRVGSVSKTFTAALTAQLAAEGILNLTAPIRTYIPDLDLSPTIYRSAVTLQTLMRHTAGVADKIVFNCEETMQDWFTAVANRPVNLEFRPGTTWAYSNLGYSTVGYAIERGLGVSFRQRMQDRIFTPLGLSATFDNGVAQNGNYATGYFPDWAENNDPELTINGATDFECSVSDPCGFLWASATDMAKFAQALLSLKQNVLSSTAIGNMRTFISTPTGDWPYYGLGLYKYTYNNFEINGHNGDAPGYHAKLVTVPDKKFAIVLLTNGEGADLDAVVNKAIDDLLPVSSTPCFTATNSAHYTAGRATKSYTSYYAKGSNNPLGRSTTTTSLQETSPGYWTKVTSCN